MKARTTRAPDHSLSTHMAMPMPPPMQSVARPFLASRFCISCSSVTSTRAPEAPTGWPMAMAPPLTLTLEVSQPRSLLTAQACAVNKDLGWDTGKVNVNGGAIAIGHPIGASGTRVLVTLLYEMQKRNAKKGLATLCIGGGMGIAMCVER